MARAREGDFNYVSLAFKSRLSMIKEIKTVLNENRDRYLFFRGTPFGPWLDLSMPGQDPLLVHMFLQKEVTVENPDPEKLYFDVYGHSLYFGQQEFCLVTGLRFEPTPSFPPLPRESFVRRVFPNAPPKELQTRHVFERMKHNMEDLPQDDAVRVCLVVMVELVFIGRELKQYVSDTVLRAVEDLQVFRSYPWGAYIWRHTFKQMHLAISRRRNPKNPTGGMTMSGFTYAFKVWILETFPIALTHFQRHMDRSPKGICWDRDRGAILSRLQCLEFFNSVENARHYPLSRLVATPAEQHMAWYRDSQAFFQGEEARRPLKRVRQPSHSPACSSPSAGSLSDGQDDEGNELPPSRHHEWDYALRNYINTHSFIEPPTYSDKFVKPNPDPLTSQVMPAKLKASCIEANNDIERLKEIWLKNRETQLQKEALIEEKKRQLAFLQQEISEEEYMVRTIKESYTGLEEMINEKAEWIIKCKNIYPL